MNITENKYIELKLFFKKDNHYTIGCYIPHLFELLSGVREKPAIILDKLKLDGYSVAMERLERYIFN